MKPHGLKALMVSACQHDGTHGKFSVQWVTIKRMVHYKIPPSVILGLCVQGACGTKSHYAYIKSENCKSDYFRAQASWIRAEPTSWTNLCSSPGLGMQMLMALSPNELTSGDLNFILGIIYQDALGWWQCGGTC